MRNVSEYIQFLYIALGSLGETMTRTIGLKETKQIDDAQFRQIDSLHYEVENKLLRLVESLERKRDSGGWINSVSDDVNRYGI